MDAAKVIGGGPVLANGRKIAMNPHEDAHGARAAGAETARREWYAIHESSPGSLFSIFNTIYGITPLLLGDGIDESERPSRGIEENCLPSSDPILTLEGRDIRCWYLGLSECSRRNLEDLEEHVDAGSEGVSDDTSGTEP
jgi:hypothetical protein